MKIIYFSPHPYLYADIASGPGAHMREMMAAFKRAGHEVLPVIMGEEIKGKDWIGQQDFKHEMSFKARIKRKVPRLLWETVKDFRLQQHDRKAKRKLLAAIRDFQPDMIYERGYYMMLSGIEAAKESDIFHVFEMNAPYPEERILMEGSSLLLTKAGKNEQIQLNQSDLIVVVSTALLDYTKARLNGNGDKIIVTPNAIDIAPQVSSPAEKNMLKKRWNIPEDATVFGFVGSIFPYHGVDKLIDAFNRLLKTHAGIHLLIVGNGHALNSLRRQVMDLGIHDNVSFTGGVSYVEAPDFIQIMDVAVMANSNWYGSPVKIFEYGAAEKAIIAPDVSPLRDALKNGIDGILVTPDQENLVRAMITMLEDLPLRDRMAKHFKEKVIAEHTWDLMSERILETAKKMLSQS